MTDTCPHMLAGCAALFARLEERINHTTEMREHIDEERDRERDSLAGSIEKLDRSIGRLDGLATKLEDHEKRLVFIEAAVTASTEQRTTFAAWLAAFRTFGPYAWTAVVVGGGALVTATLWAVRNGLVTP